MFFSTKAAPIMAAQSSEESLPMLNLVLLIILRGEVTVEFS